MHIGWRGLDPAERERFDRSVRAGHHPVNHLGFIKAFRLQVVHQIIGEIRSRMAGPTLSFAEENLLSMELSSGSFLGIKSAVDIQFRRGRKIQKLLELSHKMNLATALQDVDALLCGDYRVTVEIRGALLKLSEIFNSLESTLGTEETLDVDPAESRCVNTMAKLLRANIADQMCRAIGAAISMAVESKPRPCLAFRSGGLRSH